MTTVTKPKIHIGKITIPIVPICARIRTISYLFLTPSCPLICTYLYFFFALFHVRMDENPLDLPLVAAIASRMP